MLIGGRSSLYIENEMKVLEEKYKPEIISKIGDLAKQTGGHGGVDFLMLWRLIDCMRNGLPLDQDVYDAALWTAIDPLSEISVANGSAPLKYLTLPLAHGKQMPLSN